MSNLITGGCLCGAIRYECDGEPMGDAHFFCKDCQKISGSQMSSNLFVPKASFKVTKGQTKTYASNGDTGKTVVRHFCGECGAGLWSDAEIAPDVITIKAGSLDNPDLLQPTMSFFCASAPSWAMIPDSIPHFAKLPPM